METGVVSREYGVGSEEWRVESGEWGVGWGLGSGDRGLRTSWTYELN